MKTTKNLGIWMDHATAHVMELNDSIRTLVIHSKFTHEEREKSLQKGENLMHNKEQAQQSDYYKKSLSPVEWSHQEHSYNAMMIRFFTIAEIL